MKHKPISVGRAVDLMCEGKEVYFEGQNSTGYLRILGDRGLRNLQVKTADGWKTQFFQTELDHRFFEICEPAKVEFKAQFQVTTSRAFGRSAVQLDCSFIVQDKLNTTTLSALVGSTKGVKVTIEEI